MIVPPLVPSDHPLLHSSMPQFDFENPPVDPLELGGVLIRGMTQYDGVGLAANQVGLPYRVFALKTDTDDIVCFNPVLLDASATIMEDTEGCLSFKNLYLSIKRPTKISVQYQNAFGAVITETLGGFTARAWLHEYDHVSGITFDTLVSQLKLAMAKRKQAQRRL